MFCTFNGSKYYLINTSVRIPLSPHRHHSAVSVRESDRRGTQGYASQTQMPIIQRTSYNSLMYSVY